MAKSSHSDEVKAGVIAALLAGQSTSQVATAYNIPAGTIKTWKRRMGLKEFQSDAISEVQNETANETLKKEIGELLLKLVVTRLRALIAQAELFADKDWMKMQDVQELAVTHGILDDKNGRLLDAMSRTGDDG